MSNTFKDYYQILGLEPGAPATAIKKAWRERVRMTHPDVQQVNNQEEYCFQDIQEAYETLSNPLKKEKYLQQRWLQQVYHSKPLSSPKDSLTLLQTLIQFEQKVNRMDSYRLDIDFIKQTLLFLLAPSSITLLNSTKDKIINQQIIDLYFRCLPKLPYSFQQELLVPLNSIEDFEVQQRVRQYRDTSRLRWLLEKYQYVLAAGMVALLCWLISSLA